MLVHVFAWWSSLSVFSRIDKPLGKPQAEVEVSTAATPPPTDVIRCPSVSVVTRTVSWLPLGTGFCNGWRKTRSGNCVYESCLTSPWKSSTGCVKLMLSVIIARGRLCGVQYCGVPADLWREFPRMLFVSLYSTEYPLRYLWFLSWYWWYRSTKPNTLLHSSKWYLYTLMVSPSTKLPSMYWWYPPQYWWCSLTVQKILNCTAQVFPGGYLENIWRFHALF